MQTKTIGKQCGDQLLLLAQVFGCTLNGRPARLDLSKRTGLAEVRASDGSNRAVFNWNVAAVVLREKKGEFMTRDILDSRKDFAAASVLGSRVWA